MPTENHIASTDPEGPSDSAPLSYWTDALTNAKGHRQCRDGGRPCMRLCGPAAKVVTAATTARKEPPKRMADR